MIIQFFKSPIFSKRTKVLSSKYPYQKVPKVKVLFIQNGRIHINEYDIIKF